jgi:hypothetical protein
MIRCPWCGQSNYAIDSWCSKCSRHLDFTPPARESDPKPSGRRARMWLVPAAAALGVAIALSLPVASWLNAAGKTSAQRLPQTALAPMAPDTSPTPTASPTPQPTPSDQPAPATSNDQPAPAIPSEQPAPPQPSNPPALAENTEEAGQVMSAGDPASAVARFYQAITAHDFIAAASLWTPRMQLTYPPAEYINRRFAATQQVYLQAERTLANADGRATVYVDLVEVINGQTRRWVGTWQLVATGSGWLLNRPILRAAN